MMRTAMRCGGVTLIELMVVVTVVAILSAVAYPSYREHVMRARRADAKTVLLENAQFLERFYTQNGSYVGAVLPYTASPTTGNPVFYNIGYAATFPTVSTFQIQAVPTGAQTGDRCGTLIINQANQKLLSGATLDVASCWNR